MIDKLDMGIGSPMRTLKILDVTTKDVTMANKEEPSEKVIFQAVDEHTGNLFNISDAWLDDNKGGHGIHGLWFSTLVEDTKVKLSPASAIGRTLEHYNAGSPKAMVGKNSKALPDNNNYLVIVACNM